jgi:hypothetical protein
MYELAIACVGRNKIVDDPENTQSRSESKGRVYSGSLLHIITYLVLEDVPYIARVSAVDFSSSSSCALNDFAWGSTCLMLFVRLRADL